MQRDIGSSCEYYDITNQTVQQQGSAKDGLSVVSGEIIRRVFLLPRERFILKEHYSSKSIPAILEVELPID